MRYTFKCSIMSKLITKPEMLTVQSTARAVMNDGLNGGLVVWSPVGAVSSSHSADPQWRWSLLRKLWCQNSHKGQAPKGGHCHYSYSLQHLPCAPSGAVPPTKCFWKQQGQSIYIVSAKATVILILLDHEVTILTQNYFGLEYLNTSWLCWDD